MSEKSSQNTRIKKKGTVNASTVKSSREKKPIIQAPLFYIVGIGASAGGLETLNVFFDNMPPDSNMAFVIIQHLSPKHESIMASLLDKHTKMKVCQIEDGVTVAPDCVYLNPPGKNVAIINRTLQLMMPAHQESVTMPVDFFFRSLAQEQKEKAIGIVLSGTASDGTMGIRAIKGEGGMVMAQDPDTARYDGMPRNAIATGLVDFVLPVEKMPETLIRFIHHPIIGMPGKAEADKPLSQNHLNKVFALIRSATGHDFSLYKPKTIERRVERRMAVHQINKLSDYLVFLQKNLSEVQTLFKELNIGVTSFFRDPDAYQSLKKEVIPSLLHAKTPDTPFRLWVPGCSTGEEAYSLAMILSEVIEKTDNSDKYANVQIFASDIDEDAIAVARTGFYPKNIAADISSTRLKAFFTKESEGFKIKKTIRDMVIFSVQSIIKDPPFSRLDMVSCRNILIYMDKVLQNKILQMFHHVLNPGGVLFLGTSESIGEFKAFFSPINSKLKIFQRKEGKIDRVFKPYDKFNFGTHPENEIHTLDNALSKKSGKAAMISDIQSIVERVILDDFSVPAVLISENYEILHFAGGVTDKFLTQPRGKASFNILNMARKELKSSLTIAISKAIRDKTTICSQKVRFRTNGEFAWVDITVKPLSEKGLPPGAMLVVFQESPAMIIENNAGSRPQKTASEEETKRLEQELNAVREYLQATIEELETSNEEMQSVNEELQSVNEEMETSKEELQSSNEELLTVNMELQNRMDELSATSDDLNNLLLATEIASVFLDVDLCVKRYTPAATWIMKLVQTDFGRPLNDLKTSFPDIDLSGLAQKVLQDIKPMEMDILSIDQTWYRLKIIPYRTIKNVIDGVVLTFVDVHEVKQAGKLRRLGTVVNDSYDAVVLQDFKGNISAWNKGAEELYGWKEAEALKMNISKIIPKENEAENQVIFEKIKQGEIVKSIMLKRLNKDGNILDIWATFTALTDDSGKIIEIASTERDLAWLREKQ